MKFDLFTSAIVAIIGVAIAFVVTNIFLPEIEGVSFKILSATPSTSLTQPSDEVFNYRAINPTVEVYVGQCEEYNASGECISTITSLGSGSDSQSSSDQSSSDQPSATQPSDSAPETNNTTEGSDGNSD